MELTIEHVQIPLRRDDEHTVALEDQSFCDQLNRHLCIGRENLVGQGSYGSHVISDDDGNAYVGRQMP
jgi:hypothetical protein